MDLKLLSDLRMMRMYRQALKGAPMPSSASILDSRSENLDR